MIDVMKLALEALENGGLLRVKQAITALRQAIEQAEKQEPVAWMEDSIEFYAKDHPTNSCTIPLYTAPPKREWVGLTDEEIDKAIISTAPSFKPDDVARAIEAKLKERNT